MPPPPVTIYVTSLTSAPKVRQHIDLLHRSLKGLDIPYEAFDLVIDQDAKTRWQRAKPSSGMVIGLPGYLVGGEWIGTMDDFEQAVESGTLPQFLKQDMDLDLTAESNKSGTIGEAELEALMREMTEGDLEKLAGEIGVDTTDAKVGLIAPAQPAENVASEPAAPVTSKTDHSDTSKPDTPAKTPAISGTPTGPRVGSRASMEEKADLAREMMTTGTIDGLLKAVEKAEGKTDVKEKLD